MAENRKTTQVRTDDSPMLRRVKQKSRGGWLRIPRRGRIRVALAAVCVVWAGMAIRGVVGGDAPGGSPHNGGDAAEKENKQAHGKRAGAFHKKELAREDVAELLKSSPHRLRCAVDTLREDNQSLVLYYSVDTMLQRVGKALLTRYHPKYGAIAAIDPASGRVLSLVSYVNEGEPFLGRDLYCRSLFPAASLFKMITAAGSVEHGKLRCGSKLKQVGRNHTLYKFQLEERLSRYREISLAKAFAYSINPVFGRLGIYVLGKDGLSRYARKFGFGESIPFELDADPARITVEDSAFALAELASGFNQETRISPLFAALAVSAIAENGVIPRPSLVDSVVDPTSGECLYRSSPATWRRAIETHTAGEVKTMLRHVARYGTARKSFRYVKRTRVFNDMEYGGKTGNIDRDGIGRVDWFAGFGRHPEDAEKRIAIGVVTVHGPYWTVHSSFVAAEMIRKYVRAVHYRQKREAEEAQVAAELAEKKAGNKAEKSDEG